MSMTEAEQALETLSKVRRLLMEYGWDSTWDPVDRLRYELEFRNRILVEAEATIKSVAMMLGWGNVPPRRTLEKDISALKRRLQQVEERLATTTTKLRAVRKCLRGAVKESEDQSGPKAQG